MHVAKPYLSVFSPVAYKGVGRDASQNKSKQIKSVTVTDKYMKLEPVYLNPKKGKLFDVSVEFLYRFCAPIHRTRAYCFFVCFFLGGGSRLLFLWSEIVPVLPFTMLLCLDLNTFLLWL